MCANFNIRAFPFFFDLPFGPEAVGRKLSLRFAVKEVGGLLQITLDYTSGVPIYIQLKEAINTAIRTGAFCQGAQLPTVRQMAVQLKINANTVSRAYIELEREGVIASQQGRGTFVTLSREIDRRKLASLEQMVGELLRKAGELGFTVEDVAAVLETTKRVNRHSDYEEV